MRIDNHPILDFKKGERINFIYNGQGVYGFKGETIAAALHALGVKKLSHSKKEGRARGFFCAIGNCSSCLMKVNGVSNVRVCITPLEEGMTVETQIGRGELNE